MNTGKCVSQFCCDTHFYYVVTAPAQSVFFLSPELASTPKAGAPVSAHGALSRSGVPPGDSIWGGVRM